MYGGVGSGPGVFAEAIVLLSLGSLAEDFCIAL